jgi:hypothetical protein
MEVIATCLVLYPGWRKRFEPCIPSPLRTDLYLFIYAKDQIFPSWNAVKSQFFSS